MDEQQENTRREISQNLKALGRVLLKIIFVLPLTWLAFLIVVLLGINKEKDDNLNV